MESKEVDTKQITDLTYLVSVCGDDHEFKKDMIDTFLKTTPSLIKEMKDYLRIEEWKKIGDIAHKMKPSFTFMGIHIAKDLILALEKNGRMEQNTAEIPEMVFKLENICAKALLELQNDPINI